MRKVRKPTVKPDKEDERMKKYEIPTAEVLTLDTADIITTSFGNLPELDSEGTETPIKGFGW